MRKLSILVLSLFVLSGCQFFNFEYEEEETIEPTEESEELEEEEETEEETKPFGEMTDHFKQDVTFTEPKQIDTDRVVSKETGAQIAQAYDNSNEWSSGTTWSGYFAERFEFFEVGEINAGKYKGWKLILMNLRADGPSFSADLYRFAWHEGNNNLVHLEKYSSNNQWISSSLYPLLQDGDDVTIDGIVLPETLKIPGTNEYLTTDYLYNHYNLVDKPYGELSFSDSDAGDLYSGSDACFTVQSPDGSIATYSYDPEFFKGVGTTITWNDGGKSNMKDNYGFRPTGCGIIGNCYGIEKDVSAAGLKSVGKTSEGIELFVAKNPVYIEHDKDTPWDEQKLLSNTYDIYTATSQYSTSTNEAAVFDNFEDFVAANPILFWQDTFDRWSMLIADFARPPAECGKPVIYLYPEEPMDVKVQVFIDRFTETIPDYGRDGWTVHAQPNGTLYNYADGQTYPYLYWEGEKDGGIDPRAGFSVHRDDVEKFLDDSLTKLGLNQQEEDDFTEFWLPRMLKEDKDYFSISFVGTRDFNEIAPMSIEPSPDSLIRIFMYYHPTDRKIQIQAQTLRSIPRDGFTVIEWGGTSSAAWQNY
ncbi:hypothetical protein JKY72_06930 [Candidatus Gracilibacteria bacterium]|nr:hypothetical protein [Candidatus Gracilibacteria bacterium]